MTVKTENKVFIHVKIKTFSEERVGSELFKIKFNSLYTFFPPCQIEKIVKIVTRTRSCMLHSLIGV